MTSPPFGRARHGAEYHQKGLTMGVKNFTTIYSITSMSNEMQLMTNKGYNEVYRRKYMNLEEEMKKLKFQGGKINKFTKIKAKIYKILGLIK